MSQMRNVIFPGAIIFVHFVFAEKIDRQMPKVTDEKRPWVLAFRSRVIYIKDMILIVFGFSNYGLNVVLKKFCTLFHPCQNIWVTQLSKINVLIMISISDSTSWQTSGDDAQQRQFDLLLRRMP
jgi:hypothetical protein